MAKSTIKTPSTAFMALLLGVYLPAAFGHEVSLSCPAAFGPIPDASGLIAYYPLDGNTADVSGNGMDAIEVNAVTPAPGKVGQGYYFNGKDSFIRLAGDITPTVYPQITITAWIKPEAVNGARYIVSQGDHGNRSLFISNGTVSAGRALVGDQRHTVFAGRWVFVALTYDHATNTAVLLSDVTISAVEATTPEQPRPSVLLGAKAPGNSGFAGVIDEVRIYNRALTTTELAGLNRAGNETSVAGSTNPNQLPGDQFGGGNGDSRQRDTLSAQMCATVECPRGQICRNGGCFEDLSSLNTPVNAENACADVTCPNGQACRNGGCFDDLNRTPSSVRETASAQPGVPSYGDQMAPLPGGAILVSVDEANDAVAYPQTDVFTPSNAGELVGDAVAPSSAQPGQPLFDENPTQLPGDQFGGANPTQLPGDQFGGVNPTQLPGDQFERPSAEDIPTGPDYQVVDQSVDYVAEGTMLMPELPVDGPSGETRTNQRPLASNTVFVYAPGEAQLTEISGKRGSIVQVHMDVQRPAIKSHPYRVGTHAWEVWEHNDKLCKIRTAFAAVGECGEDQSGNPSSYKSARFNLDTSRVTALQVCTRKSNGRVKGIRIRGVGLSRTTPSGLDNAFEQAELAYSNCNGNWKALVMCPSGQVAAGLKAHFDPGKGTNKKTSALVGLQLYCRALTLVPVSGYTG